MPSRGGAGAWLLALVPFLLVLAHNWGPAPPGDAPDAYHYLLHGRALAEGSGYSNTGYIFTSLNPWIGPPVQPPGMAILLLPAFKLFGGNILVMRLVVLLCTVAFLLLAGRYFARQEGSHMGLSVFLLLGLVPTLAAFASYTYSDLVSAAALWAVIFVVDSERPFDLTKLALITVLGGMALITRLTGVSLLGALVLFTLVRYRDFGLRPLIPAAVWSAGGLAASFVLGTVIPVWAFEGFRMVRQWISTLQTYRFAVFEIMLYPLGWDLANDVYHVLAFGLLLVGLGTWIRKGWNRFVTCFVVSYVLMMASLPVTGMGRYLWPVAPFVLFGLLNGVKTSLRVVAPRLSPARLDQAVLATALTLALATTLTLLSYPRQLSLIEDPAVREVMQFVRTMDGADTARIAFEHPRLLTWETRVPAMGLPRRPDRAPIERVIEEFRARRITHVISLTKKPEGPGERILHEAMEKSPEMFALLYRGKGFDVYVIE